MTRRSAEDLHRAAALLSHRHATSSCDDNSWMPVRKRCHVAVEACAGNIRHLAVV